MSRTPTVADWAKLKEHGYRVQRVHGSRDSWMLFDSDGSSLMIGDHGCVAPTRYEAVAEALRRIDEDERFAREVALSWEDKLRAAIDEAMTSARVDLQEAVGPSFTITDELLRSAVGSVAVPHVWPDGSRIVVEA